MPAARSDCNAKFEFTEEAWVVTLLNIEGTQEENILNPFGGHSALYVEGFQQSGPGLHNFVRFKGYYDILAGPKDSTSNQCVVTQVRSFENEECKRDVKRYPSKSYYAKAEAVKTMIATIKQDQEKVIQGKEFIEYQTTHFFWTDNSKVNCTSWCAKKIMVSLGLEPDLSIKNFFQTQLKGKKPSICVIS